MKHRLFYLSLCLGATLFHGAAHAQVPAAPEAPRFGAQLSLASQVGLGVGARAEVPASQLYPGLFGLVSLDAFFPTCVRSDCGYFAFNAGAALPFPLDELLVLPYAGGGLALVYARSGVDQGSGLGLNVLGGVQVPVEGMHWTPFAELRLEFGAAGQFVLSGGILF